MGYFLLILGIGLFAGGHWVKRLAPDARPMDARVLRDQPMGWAP